MTSASTEPASRDAPAASPIADDALRVQRAAEVLSREEIDALRRKSPLKTWWMIVHCWGVIFGTWVVCVLWPNPLTITLGVLIVGCRQLGLGIVNHEAAHYLLFDDRRLNDWVARWLVNRPMFGQSVDGYRRYHLEHHRHTQQPEDPDLVLSSPFPVSRASLRRKIVRDLTGQTGWKQRRALVASHFRPADAPLGQRLARVLRRFGPNLAINGVFLAGFALAGHWYLYFLLWVLPSFTWEMLITRIRNIAEHAVVPDDDDRLRNTRTTRAGWIARIFLAPYWVNYHLEHHLLVSVPCYNLPRMHRLLLERGLGPKMELRRSYAEVLALATDTSRLQAA